MKIEGVMLVALVTAASAASMGFVAPAVVLVTLAALAFVVTP